MFTIQNKAFAFFITTKEVKNLHLCSPYNANCQSTSFSKHWPKAIDPPYFRVRKSGGTSRWTSSATRKQRGTDFQFSDFHTFLTTTYNGLLRKSSQARTPWSLDNFHTLLGIKLSSLKPLCQK